MDQAQEALRSIILPGDAVREEFLYYSVVQMTPPRPFAIAMVKLPKNLNRPFKKALEEHEGAVINWHLLDRQDEGTEGLETTRYQLRGYAHIPDEDADAGQGFDTF